MKYLPIAIMLLSTPAAAQGVPAGAVLLASDGLGDTGTAQLWNWAGSPAAPGFAHIFLQTGSNPEPYGHVTVPLSPAMYPMLADGTYPRPLCVGNFAWTGTDYTPAGFANPEPIGITVSQGHYGAPVANTVDFWWSAGNLLPPHTAYSLVVSCVSKSQHK